MKRQALIINFIVIVSFLTVIFNVGELRCQDKIDRIQAKYQTESMPKSNLEESEDFLKEDKHLRFKMLVWLIQCHLVKSYQKIDEEELVEKLQ
ncbi:MAG: hypothetical protein WC405_20600 [Syntrophales bacterium]